MAKRKKSVIACMAEKCYDDYHLEQICHAPAFIFGYTKGARDVLDKVTKAAMCGVTDTEKYKNVFDVLCELNEFETKSK